MLEDLGLLDPITLAEAHALQPRTYLVHLVWPAELPLAGMRWCRYQVEPIGTTLRPEVPEAGITADMVLPIAPNTAEWRGIEPVTPTKPFPFPNCYHWLDNGVVVRIRVPPGGFEHDGAFALTRTESDLMNEKFRPDRARIASFLLQQARLSQSPSPSPSCRPATEPSPPLDTSNTAPSLPSGALPRPSSPDTLGIPLRILSDAFLRIAKDKGVMTSTPPKSRKRTRTPRSNSQGSVGATAPSPSEAEVCGIVDVFGRAPDPITPLIPLVDAWLDIENHLTADTIADPRELEKDVQAVIRMIKRGIARQLLAEEAQRDVQRTLGAALETH